MSVAMPASLMKGKLREKADGDYHVDGSVSDASFQDGINFLKDDVGGMTIARRIALNLGRKYKWYNPQLGETENGSEVRPSNVIETTFRGLERKATAKPSLEKAWAYFEHVALDRYIIEEKDKNKPKKDRCTRIMRKFQKGDKKLEKAEPGEKDLETRLYSPWFTPHGQLGDFGLGLGLYFSTLRAITVITLLAGLISIHNIAYFDSEDYTTGVETNGTLDELLDEALLRGSAICKKLSWVPCPDCQCTDGLQGDSNWQRSALFDNRCGVAEDLLDPSQNITFGLRNDCVGSAWQLGAVNYATVLLTLFCTIVLGRYLRNQEVQFDEDEQTAQDYSVKINNPPPDAIDPDEWFNFFKENFNEAHATVCTCAVDNDFLVRTLVERREILKKIQGTLEPGTKLSTLELAHRCAKEEHERTWVGRLKAMVLSGLPEWYARLVALDAKVQGLSQLDYPVTNVFLTFETESDQRYVLQRLSMGSLKAKRNDARALASPKYLFRGKHVLAVSEPDEPSTIRWQDLNATSLQMMKEQLMTIIATLVAVAVVTLVVSIANDTSAGWAAICISAFNSVFPVFAKILTNLEAHASEGEKQTSLYFKIALFRWVNTAVVITIVTPFTDTLAEEGLIPKVYTLFFSEIVFTSVIQLADPFGHIKRHIFAPRAGSQDEMNLQFQGTEFELAERYTDMTKLLFLALWYGAIFPGAYYLCSFALLVKYFIDRFSLMRTWKRAPQLGTRVSRFSRRYFFSLACVAMAVVSSFYWSGFPFDNLCPTEQPNSDYIGNFMVENKATGETSPVSLGQNTAMEYKFCNQNLLAMGKWAFPFIPEQQPENEEWMSEEQAQLTEVFGWTSVAIIGLVIIMFVSGWVDLFRGLFRSTYEAVGDDQNIPFSTVASRSGYIPQVTSPSFSYPLLACDSDCIDEELYDWTDPDRPYTFYDLTVDAGRLLSGTNVSENVGFSRIKHFPPPQEKLDNGEKTQNGVSTS